MVRVDMGIRRLDDYRTVVWEVSMRERIWKHRAVAGFVSILILQAPFLTLKLTIADEGIPNALVEVFHVLLTSGLAVYLFSRGFETRLQDWLYGSFRHDWKEVKVYYTDLVFRGTGDGYPREPTLLVHAPMWEMMGVEHPFANKPMSISFNSAYKADPPRARRWRLRDRTLERNAGHAGGRRAPDSTGISRHNDIVEPDARNTGGRRANLIVAEDWPRAVIGPGPGHWPAILPARFPYNSGVLDPLFRM